MENISNTSKAGYPKRAIIYASCDIVMFRNIVAVKLGKWEHLCLSLPDKTPMTDWLFAGFEK